MAGEFKPGDRITADADRVTGTLVFSTGTATVVTENAPKRDARIAHGSSRSRRCRVATGSTSGRTGESRRRGAYPRPTMRYEDVLRRLEDLPESLPAPAEILMPVLVGAGERGPATCADARRRGGPAGRPRSSSCSTRTTTGSRASS